MAKLIAWKQAGTHPKWKEIFIEGETLKDYLGAMGFPKVAGWVAAERNQAHKRQILIPEKLRHVVLKAVHDALTSGHMGVWRTLASLRNRFFWPRIRKDVISWCEFKVWGMSGL